MRRILLGLAVALAGFGTANAGDWGHGLPGTPRGHYDYTPGDHQRPRPHYDYDPGRYNNHSGSPGGHGYPASGHYAPPRGHPFPGHCGAPSHPTVPAHSSAPHHAR